MMTPMEVERDLFGSSSSSSSSSYVSSSTSSSTSSRGTGPASGTRSVTGLKIEIAGSSSFFFPVIKGVLSKASQMGLGMAMMTPSTITPIGLPLQAILNFASGSMTVKDIIGGVISVGAALTGTDEKNPMIKLLRKTVDNADFINSLSVVGLNVFNGLSKFFKSSIQGQGQQQAPSNLISHPELGKGALVEEKMKLDRQKLNIIF